MEDIASGIRFMSGLSLPNGPTARGYIGYSSEDVLRDSVLNADLSQSVGK